MEQDDKKSWRVEPCDEIDMKDKAVWGKSTPDMETDLCTVLRAIYHRTRDPQIRIRCRVATAMGIKMRIAIMRHKEGL